MLGDEFIQVIRKWFRLKRIDCLPIHIKREPRIWNARNRQRGVFAKEANRLAHVFGPRGTIETDDINAHAFKDRKRCVDISAK